MVERRFLCVGTGLVKSSFFSCFGVVGLTYFSLFGVQGWHSFLLNFDVVKGSLISPVFGVLGSHMSLSFDVLRNVYKCVMEYIRGLVTPQSPL